MPPKKSSQKPIPSLATSFHSSIHFQRRAKHPWNQLVCKTRLPTKERMDSESNSKSWRKLDLGIFAVARSLRPQLVHIRTTLPLDSTHSTLDPIKARSEKGTLNAFRNFLPKSDGDFSLSLIELLRTRHASAWYHSPGRDRHVGPNWDRVRFPGIVFFPFPFASFLSSHFLFLGAALNRSIIALGVWMKIHAARDRHATL